MNEPLPSTPMKSQGRRRRWFKLIALIASTLLALLIGEVAVRMIGSTDADGNFSIRGRIVGRRHPPVEWVRSEIERYRTSDDTRMIYDSRTGWSPRPGFSESSGRYRYNSVGIRSAPTEHALQPADGVLRIALFGDSFTHGDDIPFEQTWGRQLELMLRRDGVNAEVINFGVSAYGMDQAYLRWRELGRRYRPHVVLFGFQPENVARNVNIFRGFYVQYTGIPFSKPRFVLDEAGRLEPVNLPTLPLERVPQVMSDMGSWHSWRHEWFYRPHRFRRRWWHFSRLASLLMDVRRTSEPDVAQSGDVYDPASEPARVTLQLLRKFRDEVEQRGAIFRIVHLPRRTDVAHLLDGGELSYAAVWQQVEREFNTIDPLPALLQAARTERADALYVPHFSARGGEIVSRAIGKALQ